MGTPDDVRTAVAHARDAANDAATAIEHVKAVGTRCQWIAEILETHLRTCGARPSIGRDTAVTMQGNRRIAKDSETMFLERVERGDEIAKAVMEIVERYGLTISATTTVRAVRCTQLLERMYLQDPSLLDRTVRTVVRAWDRQPASLRGIVIEGVATFYADHGDADEDHLAAVLRTVSVPDLLRQTVGAGRRRKMAELFADLYTSHQTLF